MEVILFCETLVTTYLTISLVIEKPLVKVGVKYGNNELVDSTLTLRPVTHKCHDYKDMKISVILIFRFEV
jgi:hypothetical protein